MSVKKIEIRYLQKDRPVSSYEEGTRHIKALPWVSIVQSVKGSYTVKVGESEFFETGAGGFFLAPSQITQDITHHVDPETGKTDLRWVFMDITVNDRFAFDSLFDLPVTLMPADREEMNRLFDRLFAADNPCDEMSTAYQIVKLLLRVSTEREEGQSEPLAEVHRYIRKHYREEISVETLAGVAHSSVSHFYQIFREAFGSSPIVYLNRFRLALASDKLTRTDAPVNQIARDVGFDDPLYFSKSFKKLFRVSPLTYRKQTKT